MSVEETQVPHTEIDENTDMKEAEFFRTALEAAVLGPRLGTMETLPLILEEYRRENPIDDKRTEYSVKYHEGDGAYLLLTQTGKESFWLTAFFKHDIRRVVGTKKMNRMDAMVWHGQLNTGYDFDDLPNLDAYKGDRK